MTMTMTTTLSIRRIVRREANSHSNCPVKIVAGNAAPQIVGRSYYWTTLSGKTEVRHPNAYGWPTLYHGSTIRVQVGADWVAARCPDYAAALQIGAGI